MSNMDIRLARSVYNTHNNNCIFDSVVNRGDETKMGEKWQRDISKKKKRSNKYWTCRCGHPEAPEHLDEASQL